MRFIKSSSSSSSTSSTTANKDRCYPNMGVLFLTWILVSLAYMANAYAMTDPNRLIIQLNAGANIKNAIKEFDAGARRLGLDFKLKYEFSTLFTGFSIYTETPYDEDMIESLDAIEGVVKVHKVMIYTTTNNDRSSFMRRSQLQPNFEQMVVQKRAPGGGDGEDSNKKGKGHNNDGSDSSSGGGVRQINGHRFDSKEYSKFNKTISPVNGATTTDMYSMTGVDKLHKLGYYGEGIRIGIIDSGVDYTHPELGGCYKTAGCPIQFGRNFIRSDEDPSSNNDENDPYDNCSGHGTAVAGIVAGQGPNVRGIAPKATYGIYKIATCNQNSFGTTVTVLQAMEQAYKDKMDIVNFSLGRNEWPELPVSVAATNLTKKGVIVVSAAGNSGIAGLFTASSPAIGDGVISVGSVNPNTITSNRLDVMMGPNSNRSIPYMAASNFIPFTSKKPVPLVLVTDPDGTNYGCRPYTAAAGGVGFKGKVALALRGGCSLDQMANNAQDAGASALLIAFNDTTLASAGLRSRIRIPILTLVKADGEKLIKDAKTLKNITVSADGGYVTEPVQGGGKMSSFSSWGPTPELNIGLAVSAPGGYLFTTYPVGLGAFITQSGTSLSAPYVAGVAALILQSSKRIKRDPELIRDIIIQHTKLVKPSSAGNANNHQYMAVGADSALRQGNGLIDVVSASKATIVSQTSSITLNYTTNYYSPIVKTIKLQNLDQAKGNILYFNHIPAQSYSQYDPTTGRFSLNPVTDTQSASMVGLPPPQYIQFGKTIEVAVSILPPLGLSPNGHWFYSGYIQVRSLSGETLNIPYMGYKGDFKRLPFLTSDPAFEPKLVYTTDDGKVIKSIGGGNETEEPYVIDKGHRIGFDFTGNRPARIVRIQLLQQQQQQQQQSISSNNSTTTGQSGREKYKVLGYLTYGYQEFNPILAQQYQAPYNPYFKDVVYSDTNEQKPVKIKSGGEERRKFKVRLSALKIFGNPRNPQDYE
ncbi:hypothetical protein H4219_005732, partial [Mycoemilia scoparia]